MTDRYLDATKIRALATHLGLRPSKGKGQNFLYDANTIRRIVNLAQIGPDDTILEIGPGLGSLTIGLLHALNSHGTQSSGQPSIDPTPLTSTPTPLTGTPSPLTHRPGAAEGGGSNTCPTSPTALETDATELGAAPTDCPPRLVAVEIEPSLAGQLPLTMAELAPDKVKDLSVVVGDALRITPADLPIAPSMLVANLPYNIAVPVILHTLATFPSIQRGLVMVQAEVADRLVAPPGSKTYGVPSAKLAWYATSARVGTVPPSVFWPAPNVDSGLVRFTRHPPGQKVPVLVAQSRATSTGTFCHAGDEPATSPRDKVFALIDAAFAQRRKMLRSALTSSYKQDQVLAALTAAGIDPQARGETLSIADFSRLAAFL